MPDPFHHVFHPTPLDGGSKSALATALRIAHGHGGVLDVFHVAANKSEPEIQVRAVTGALLQKWGTAAPGREPTLILNEVTRVAPAPAPALSNEIQSQGCDLVVLATEARTGLPRLLNGSLAERVTRDGGKPTLLLPDQCRPIVDVNTGKPKLRHVAYAVGPGLPHDKGPAALRRLADALDVPKLLVTLVFVGDRNDMPEIDLSDYTDWSFVGETPWGELITGIVSCTAEVDLLVMITEGHNSLTDAVMGSTTERVLRQCSCPVLAVPV